MAMFSKKNTFYALYAMGAFAFFLWFLFPSDFFADYLEALIGREAGGAVVTIRDARPGLTLGLSLKDVECQIPDGPLVRAEKLKVRPGLMSLFRGDPEIAFSMKSYGGRISGQLVIPEKNPDKMSVETFTVSGLDLFALKDVLGSYIPGYTIRGSLDASGSYSPEGRGNGTLSLAAQDLFVEPERPFFTVSNLTFPSVTAEVELKSKKIQIQRCVVDGQEVDGNMTGSIFIRTPLDRSSLRLSGTVKPDKGFMEKMGASMPIDALIGKKMNADGEIPFSISGVINSPRYSLK